MVEAPVTVQRALRPSCSIRSSRKKGSSRPPKDGLRWTKDAIARVLRNPLYAGFMMYGDELHPGEHPPLIEESTYRAAQAILAGTSRVVRWTGTNPDYVLRSLVRA